MRRIRAPIRTRPKQRARAKIDGLLKQIKEGADFARAGQGKFSLSVGPRRGDLGFLSKGQDKRRLSRRWLLNCRSGQVSDIVETEYGYHIIKVTDHKDASIVSFEQAKADIVEQLTQEKQAKFVEDYINSLKAMRTSFSPLGRRRRSTEHRPGIQSRGVGQERGGVEVGASMPLK